MNATFLISFLLGAATVVQIGLNRQISATWGYSGAALLNSIVVFLVTLSIYLVSRFAPQSVPEILRDRASFHSFSWWYVISGFCGCGIVLGLPIAIEKMGAVRTFVFFLAGQLLFSLFWDQFVEKVPVGVWKIAGTILVFLGTVLANSAR